MKFAATCPFNARWFVVAALAAIVGDWLPAAPTGTVPPGAIVFSTS
jgi:hypothetical protein